MPNTEISEREQEVFDLVRQGLRNKEIAQRLIITEGTVKCHIKSIFRKLEVDSRTTLLIKQLSVLAEKVQALNSELEKVKTEKDTLLQKIALLEGAEKQNNEPN